MESANSSKASSSKIVRGCHGLATISFIEISLISESLFGALSGEASSISAPYPRPNAFFLAI